MSTQVNTKQLKNKEPKPSQDKKVIDDNVLLQRTTIPFQSASLNTLATLIIKSASLLSTLSPASRRNIENIVKVEDLPIPTVMQVLTVELHDETNCTIIYNYKKDGKIVRVKSTIPLAAGLLVNEASQIRPLVLIYMGVEKTGKAIFRAATETGTTLRCKNAFDVLPEKSMRQINAYFEVANLQDFPTDSVICFQNPEVITKSDRRWNGNEETLLVQYRSVVDEELLIGDMRIPHQIASAVTSERFGVILFKGLSRNADNSIFYNISVLAAHQAFVQASELADNPKSEDFLNHFDDAEKEDCGEQTLEKLIYNSRDSYHYR